MEKIVNDLYVDGKEERELKKERAIATLAYHLERAMLLDEIQRTSWWHMSGGWLAFGKLFDDSVRAWLLLALERADRTKVHPHYRGDALELLRRGEPLSCTCTCRHHVIFFEYESGHYVRYEDGKRESTL